MPFQPRSHANSHTCTFLYNRSGYFSFFEILTSVTVSNIKRLNCHYTLTLTRSFHFWNLKNAILVCIVHSNRLNRLKTSFIVVYCSLKLMVLRALVDNSVLSQLKRLP